MSITKQRRQQQQAAAAVSSSNEYQEEEHGQRERRPNQFQAQQDLDDRLYFTRRLSIATVDSVEISTSPSSIKYDLIQLVQVHR
jgi:hypothetical protein